MSGTSNGWIDKIEERLRARAGNAPAAKETKPTPGKGAPVAGEQNGTGRSAALPLSEEKIQEIVRRFKK